MQIYLALLKFGVFNSILIGILFLINQKGNMVANRLFGLLICFLSAVVLENLLIISGEIFSFPHFFSVGSIMLFLVPPTVYFLQMNLVGIEKKMSVFSYLLHGLPFLFGALALLPLFLSSGAFKSRVIQEIYFDQIPIQRQYLAFSAINILQFGFYHFKALKIIRTKHQQLQTKKSVRHSLPWINRLLFLLNILMFAYLGLYISLVYTAIHNPFLMLVFLGILLMTIYITSFHLIKNPFYFSSYQGVYQRSTLKKEHSSVLTQKLEEVLDKQQAYLNPRLKLAELAEKLEVTPHQLSQYINQTKDYTFSQLLNSYRVRHAQQLLKEDKEKKLTILAIALDSGFSSQANFIKVFKEATRLTPSQYRKENKTFFDTDSTG